MVKMDLWGIYALMKKYLDGIEKIWYRNKQENTTKSLMMKFSPTDSLRTQKKYLVYMLSPGKQKVKIFPVTLVLLKTLRRIFLCLMKQKTF